MVRGTRPGSGGVPGRPGSGPGTAELVHLCAPVAWTRASTDRPVHGTACPQSGTAGSSPAQASASGPRRTVTVSSETASGSGRQRPSTRSGPDPEPRTVVMEQVFRSTGVICGVEAVPGPDVGFRTGESPASVYDGSRSGAAAVVHPPRVHPTATARSTAARQARLPRAGRSGWRGSPVTRTFSIEPCSRDGRWAKSVRSEGRRLRSNGRPSGRIGSFCRIAQACAPVLGEGDVAPPGDRRPGQPVVRGGLGSPDTVGLDVVVEALLGPEVGDGSRSDRPGDLVVEVAPAGDHLAAGTAAHAIDGPHVLDHLAGGPVTVGGATQRAAGPDVDREGAPHGAGM